MRDTHGKPVRSGKEEKKSESSELAHMERTKAEKKEANGLVMPKSEGPDYPYGLRIHLNQEDLQKIGMNDMPEAGNEVHLHAKARVSSVSSDQRDGGKEERRMELQITHLGIHHKADGMKSEDQGGKEKVSAGHVTEKREPHYGRKRH